MYYVKKNVYINEDNNVLFDLNKLNIYKLDNDTLKVFNEIYYGKEFDMNTDKVKEVFEEFFKENENDVKEEDYITNVRLNISNICNLRCSYCYANHGNYGNENNKMSAQLSKEICKYIEANYPYVKEISFFGGEPLLNVEVLEIVCDYFSNKNINFSIVTNLTILNDHIIDLINKYNISITGSIDGPKDINDLNRVTINGEGTYEKISNNISNLNLKTSKSLRMIEATYTKHSFEKYSRQQLAEHIYNNFKVDNILFGDVITDDEKLKLPDEYYHNNIENLQKNIDYFFNNIINKRFSLLDATAGPILFFFTKKHFENFCNAGIKSVLIDDIGNIWPCQGYINKKDFYMGNVLKDNSEATNFKKVKATLKSIKKSNLKNCSTCVAKYWCDLCIANTSLVDPEQPSYFNEKKCDYYRKLTEKTLDTLSYYVKNNMAGTISKNFKELIENR